ncbi:MAG: NAD(P)H-dependent glycerol-3-phosphate dehydrogenase [Pseudomonadota bacterium]
MNGPIAILGQGAWGQALGSTLSAAGRDVVAWDRKTDDSLLAKADLVLAAVPAQATREVLRRVATSLRAGVPLVLTAKGLETGTQNRQSQIAAQIVRGNPAIVLSGPGFAADLTKGLPTAVTLAVPATFARSDAEVVQARLATPSLRPYLTTDMIGVELGGALKNVIAIACGVAIGAGLGESARAALMARGLGEMSRIAIAFGAHMATLQGLSGLGDLVLTSTSAQSRNYSYGLALGEAGRAPEEGTYEGTHTAGAAVELCTSMGFDAPIIRTTAALVAGRLTVSEAITQLTSRPLRHE